MRKRLFSLETWAKNVLARLGNWKDYYVPSPNLTFLYNWRLRSAAKISKWWLLRYSLYMRVVMALTPWWNVVDCECRRDPRRSPATKNTLAVSSTDPQSNRLSLAILGYRSNEIFRVSNSLGYYQDNSFAEPVSASLKLWFFCNCSFQKQLWRWGCWVQVGLL